MEVESCVPPGFRFHPTEEELVGYYLTRKVNSQSIDLGVINDIDLYRIEPWDLQDRCKLGYEEQSEWYFFSHKDKKYPTGTRTNRATAAGFWKATGRDKVVHSKHKIIGMRKTLVFYKGRAPNGRKTDWIMHEYRLQTTEHGPPQEEGWVVCRAFRKQSPNQRRSVDAWEPNYFLRDHQQLGSQTLADVVINSNPAHVSNNNISYMNYMAADPVEAVCHDDEGFLSNKQNQYFGQLLDLPQLESPSSLSNSFTSKEGMETTTASINEEQGQCCRGTTTGTNSTTDHKAGSTLRYEEAQRISTTTDQWRTLENLIAPQLINEDGALSSTSTLPSINPDLEYYEQVHVLNGGGTGFNMMSSFPATYRSW